MVCVCGQSAGPYMRALLSGSAVCSYCHNLNDAQAVALPYSASYRDNQCVMSTGDCLLILLALWIIYFIAPAHKSLLHLMVYTDFVTDVHQHQYCLVGLARVRLWPCTDDYCSKSLGDQD